MVLKAVATLLLVAGLPLLLAAASSSPGPEAASPAAAAFEYALPVNPYELDAAQLGEVLDLAEGAGATTIAAGANWWYVAPRREKSERRWEPLDAMLLGAEERGLSVRLQVAGTPDWAHPYLAASVPDPEERIWYPPKGEEERALFEGFLVELVGRYGTRVSGYELWNEPNYDRFWRPGPDPEAYAELLRGAHEAVKGADPEAQVVYGGISMNDTAYLEAFYDAAERYPDARAEGFFFDELSVHPYTYGQSPDDAANGLSAGGAPAAEGDPRDTGPGGLFRMKRVMDERGDAGKLVFVGEFGYSTTETFMPAIPDAVRAGHLVRAVEISRSLPYVSGICWYGFVPGVAIGPEWTLVDEGLRPNETYRALAEAARAAGVDPEAEPPSRPGRRGGVET